ncbi:MAG: hypothetical protein EXR55_05645 [Dehalococcoidia bacterium]|nr:hypothetical protein [Dehalococcoidia bacterium]
MEVCFTLPDPAYEAYTWVYQDEHTPVSVTPLIADAPAPFGRESGRTGRPPRSICINGYNHAIAGAASPFGEAPSPQTVEEITRWREEWLPQVQTLAEQLTSCDPAAVSPGRWEQVLSDYDVEGGRVFAGVHRTAVLLARIAVERFQNAYAQRFGEERRPEALALLQGFPNRSMDRKSALWGLSRLVRSNARLSQALEQLGKPTDETSAGNDFRRVLEGVLDEFGHTTNMGLQDLPTWREDPAIPLALVRGYARLEEDHSPRAAASKQRETRLRMEEDLKARAQADPSVAALLPLLEMAQQFFPNLEDHNLLADQRLASAEDVFYYRRAELVSALEGGEVVFQEMIAARRTLQEAYREASPPRVLGNPMDDTPASDAPMVERRGEEVLRGVPASAGSYRGRALVVESLAGAARLVQGDVLVCTVITPPWSPYFALVGAAVTNAGGILSHGAIVAREFGIPAVVGTKNATSLIPDGATVTVDGTKGIVIVER